MAGGNVRAEARTYLNSNSKSKSKSKNKNKNESKSKSNGNSEKRFPIGDRNKNGNRRIVR